MIAHASSEYAHVPSATDGLAKPKEDTARDHIRKKDREPRLADELVNKVKGKHRRSLTSSSLDRPAKRQKEDAKDTRDMKLLTNTTVTKSANTSQDYETLFPTSSNSISEHKHITTNEPLLSGGKSFPGLGAFDVHPNWQSKKTSTTWASKHLVGQTESFESSSDSPSLRTTSSMRSVFHDTGNSNLIEMGDAGSSRAFLGNTKTGTHVSNDKIITSLQTEIEKTSSTTGSKEVEDEDRIACSLQPEQRLEIPDSDEDSDDLSF